MTNQDHLFNILDDVLVLLSGQGFPTPEKTYKLDGGWGLALSDLRRCFDRYRTRIAELGAEREEAMAEAVEAERWDNTDVVRTMGPHFCDFFFGGPGAADFLQQQLAAACREAAARELEGLMESEWKWEEFELKASIYARLADLRNEQPAACLGKEDSNA